MVNMVHSTEIAKQITVGFDMWHNWILGKHFSGSTYVYGLHINLNLFKGKMNPLP